MIAKIIVLGCLLLIHSFAHKIQGFELRLMKKENDTVLIEAKMKNSSKLLNGNKVQLVSMVDSRVLFEGILENNLHVQIPKESYWVYVYIGDSDIVQEGPAPKNGFDILIQSQQDKAFFYTLTLSLLFILLALLLSIYKTQRYKKFRTNG